MEGQCTSDELCYKALPTLKKKKYLLLHPCLAF